MNYSVWDVLRKNWRIKKSDIILLGIDASKPWGFVTIDELSSLADHLDVLPSDLLN